MASNLNVTRFYPSIRRSDRSRRCRLLVRYTTGPQACQMVRLGQENVGDSVCFHYRLYFCCSTALVFVFKSLGLGGGSMEFRSNTTPSTNVDDWIKGTVSHSTETPELTELY